MCVPVNSLPYSAMLFHTESYLVIRVVLSHTLVLWVVLSHTLVLWVTLSHESYMYLVTLSHRSHTESYWVIRSHTESYGVIWVIRSHTESYWVILSRTHIDIFICSVIQVKLTRLNPLLVRWVCSPYWATPPPPWKSLVSSAKRRRRILPHRSGHSSRLSMCNNHVCWESARLAILVQVCIVYVSLMLSQI